MIGRIRWHIAEVESTQTIAFRLAELGAAHGTVVSADFQSHGRGRQGRAWEASRGSALMFSVILQPQIPLHQLGSVSILVAEALADVFGMLTTHPIRIKWPNDVLIDGQKTCGILLQTRSGPEPVAVLGIGINISSLVGSLPKGATSLGCHSANPVDTESLFDSVLSQLDRMWRTLQPALTVEARARLDSRLWMRGELVSILDADREIQGRILGVAKSGGLRLDVNGYEQEIVAGEITRGPRPINQ